MGEGFVGECGRLGLRDGECLGLGVERCAGGEGCAEESGVEKVYLHG